MEKEKQLPKIIVKINGLSSQERINELEKAIKEKFGESVIMFFGDGIELYCLGDLYTKIF